MSKYGLIFYVFYPDEYLSKRDPVIQFQKWFLNIEEYQKIIIVFCIKHNLFPYEFYLDFLK